MKDKLVKFQKRAARVIFDCDFIHHPQNYLKNSIGKYFQKDVSYTSNISCRDTRSTNCNQLFTPKLNCELFRKSFMYSGAAIWNSLPLHVKNATSVNTSKSLYLKWKRLNGHWIPPLSYSHISNYISCIVSSIAEDIMKLDTHACGNVFFLW